MPRPVPIAGLLTGKAVALPGGALPVLSGIAKRPRVGALWLGREGLAGDEQGDRVYHGGPDKALHHYAAEHYAQWRDRFPDSAVPLEAGAFGENVSTAGMTEQSVHIGDVYRAGETLLQVTQGRQPCFKLNLRLGRPDAALVMQISGRTGWYYRVLREGWLAAGDGLELVERPHPAWPLARLIEALYPADLGLPALREEWVKAAGLPELAERWRQTFVRRLATGVVEDWSLRLYGPPAIREPVVPAKAGT